jgi:hypothetical protein
MSEQPLVARDRYAETAVQRVALIAGIVFLVVGIAGFIPGLTSNYDDLSFAGHGSMAELMGVFQVSVLHNIVHLAYGVVGLICARRFRWSRNYLIWGGVIYALLWIYGLITGGMSSANFVPLNTADNWLHFALAVLMIGLGLLLGRAPATRRA